ncbi:carbohydrate ABC transporter permease [Paenibacillus sp. URB8-2]|uniref:carbohydrate ABC transporter permease n=1 Tax=Paenibacillus sp. URB8-2 TaxID=2741301 RepID=UPI0015C0B529|nr:sugar ABC transporter permease [Paenibacillus sp. URB8-2]BCG57065.1 ABC transporter [Paenibacillus sp. URB8-2]
MNTMIRNSWGKTFLSLIVLLLNIAVHRLFWNLFRDFTMPIPVTIILALIWGVLGLYLTYYSLNWIVEQMNGRWKGKILPVVFIGPAVLLLAWLLLFPAIRTLLLSFFNADSSVFVGLGNYIAVFTERTLQMAIRNNLLWVLIGTSLSVSLGLIVAVLADRSSFEKTAKSILFMPMAISFVAIGIIWKFVYYYKPGDEQIGLLNAVVVALGGEPQAWIGLIQPWNNLFLIATMVWTQTGFAMVMLSAAIKGIPEEILEAARVDGANERIIFFQIIIPYIQSTIWTVLTTIVVFTLKIFDIIMIMTGGQYGTEVIATQYYKQFFNFRNFGYGSSLAMILMIILIPVIVYNLRMFKKEGRM